MIFEFYPWTLDVDIESTKELYLKMDDAMDCMVNTKFTKQLSEKQKNFFSSIGVNPMKIKIAEKIYDIPSDGEIAGGKVSRISIHFLLCGKFLAIPAFQQEIYSDEALGLEIPNSLKITQMHDDDNLPTYDIDGLGLGVVFKHPCTRFKEAKYQKWDCGYIVASILIFTDL